MREQQEFRTVPIGEVVPSKINPRRHFDGMEELTANVKQYGVLEALLVRPVNSHLEIIGGERRYRAAKAAGLTDLPVRVKDMTDDEAALFIVLANLHRKDLHELDEALGYKRLEELGHSVEDIAAKVDKSPSYVYQRLKLAALIEPGQKLFLEGGMTAGHAIQLARLHPKHQKEIIGWLGFMGCSTRDLAEHIDNNYHLRLARAGFPTKDENLLPVAGACTTCPKRSGANPMLFPDIKEKDTCSDPICFHEKEKAFVKLQLDTNPEAKPLSVVPSYADNKTKAAGLKDWTPAPGKPCDSSTVGIVAEIQDKWEGERQKVKLGQLLQVCTDPKCKVHHPPQERSDYSPSTGKSKKKEKARKLELKRRGAIFKAMMLRAAKDPNTGEMELILAYVISTLNHDHAKALCDAMGWEAKKDKYGQRNYEGLVEKELLESPSMSQKALLAVAIAATDLWFHGEPEKIKLLEDAASRRGVDVKAINKEQKEAGEKKTKAKKVKAA